ncbi:Prefoldin subunit 5 [Mitosporidium daphniae]
MSSPKVSGPPGSASPVSISQLLPAQLNQLREQLEKEVDLFQASYDSLKIALDRFASCRQSLDELGSEAQGGEILVPLSSSVYVPGNLSDISRATVDIGAGYYVEKSISSAKEFYKRKESFLQEQLNSIIQNLSAKQDMHSVIIGELQRKIALNRSSD